MKEQRENEHNKAEREKQQEINRPRLKGEK
jgi:hypothetical protein